MNYMRIVVALGIFMFAMQSTLAQGEWTYQGPEYQYEKNWKIFSGSSNIVALVNSGNEYLKSSDGHHWTRGNTNAVLTPTRMVWTGSHFVGIAAIDYQGPYTFATSADGITWVASESEFRLNMLSLIWTGTQLMAGDDSGKIYTSPDGITWKVNKERMAYTVQDHFPEPVRFLMWTGSLYLAIGYTNIFSSPDGIKWTRRAAQIEGFETIIFNGNKLFAYTFEGAAYTSQNGITWNRASIGGPRSMTDLQWTGTYFIALNEGYLISSMNGIDWIDQDFGDSTFKNITGLKWTGQEILAINDFGIIAQGKQSNQGISWTMIRRPPFSPDLYSVVSSPSQSITVGESGTILGSTDVINWTPRTSGSSHTLRAITWSGNQFVTVGDSGTILASLNGESWTTKNSGTRNTLLTIEWTGNQFLAGGIAGTILTSPDGNTWTKRQANTTLGIHVIKGNGSQIIAGGDSALILTSSDGIDWTRRKFVPLKGYPSPIHPYRSIAWAGTRIYAVGGLNSSNQVSYSTDGIKWSFTRFEEAASANAIILAENQLIALGSYYMKVTLLNSFFGYWKNLRAPSSFGRYNAITWTGKHYIVVGDNRMIFTSPSSVPTKIANESHAINTLTLRTFPTFLSINLPDNMVDKIAKVRVFNLSGKKVFEQMASNVSGQLKIQNPKLSPGRYLLQVQGSKSKLSKPFYWMP